jgi:hypothetical protein
MTISSDTPADIVFSKALNLSTAAVVLLGVFGLMQSGDLAAKGQPATTPVLAQKPPVERDGQHDFDFNIGVWHTHIKRLRHTPSGSSETVELNGTVSVRKVWGGRAQLEEIEADGPDGHWEGMTLFLYNPQAHQWNQVFFDSAVVDPNNPPLVGSFHDGRGELFGEDTLKNGKVILVRGVWSDFTPTSHRFEEAHSTDGGQTWEVVFTAELTRLAAAAAGSSQGKDGSGGAGGAEDPGHAQDPGHAFDFDFGTWKTHSSRLLHPLTGSTQWADMDGRTIVSRIWGGRGNLAEYEAQGPAGHVELLALRLYNPNIQQWYLNFAHPDEGTLGVPAFGTAKDGRITFYDQEPIKGKAVLVRFSIWGIGSDSGQSEQAFSTDGGRTWEVNWVNKYTREK